MVYRRGYRKNYRGRGRGRGKVPWFRKKYSAMQLAGKAYQAARYVKSLVNVEKKVHNVSTTNAGGSTPEITPLHNIAQGTDIGERTGNSIKATGLSMKMTLLLNASATSGSLFRCVIVKDNQQIGDTTPGWTDVFESSSINTFLNQDTLGRFSILMDKIYALNNDSTTERMCVQKHFKLQHHIRYNGALNTDIQKGGLYLMYVSTEPTLTVSVDANLRLRYVDN